MRSLPARKPAGLGRCARAERPPSPWSYLPCRLAGLLLGGLLSLGLAGAASAAPAYSEAEVKAAFLLRFASYIEWPARVVSRPEFVIGVVGDEAVRAALQRLADEVQVQGKPIRLRTLDAARVDGELAILYVGAAGVDDIRAGGGLVAPPGTLVVTHAAAGLAAGAGINFVLVDRRVRFEVSLNALRRAGLSVDSGLLSVATRVEDDRRGAMWCAVVQQGALFDEACGRRLSAARAAETGGRRVTQRRRT